MREYRRVFGAVYTVHCIFKLSEVCKRRDVRVTVYAQSINHHHEIERQLFDTLRFVRVASNIPDPERDFSYLMMLRGASPNS